MTDLLWWEREIEMFRDYIGMRWSVWQDADFPDSERENFGCIAEALWAKKNGLA